MVDVRILPDWISIAGLVISVFLAIGTIALAVVALLNIRQNVKVRRNELLEEVIEWATGIGNITVNFTADTIERLKNTDSNLYIQLKVDEAIRTTKYLKTKTQNIVDIIEGFNIPSLRRSTASFIEEFESYVNALNKWNEGLTSAIQNPSSDETWLIELAIAAGSQEYLLGQKASNFIAEVHSTRIKNKL